MEKSFGTKHKWYGRTEIELGNNYGLAGMLIVSTHGHYVLVGVCVVGVSITWEKGW